MKPARFSPAHTSAGLAELVCSNSLRSNSLENAVGLLKEEMRLLDSIIIAAADATAVPAGKALAVNRVLFSREVETRLTQMPGFELVRQEANFLPEEGLVIITTGPLTSEAFTKAVSRLTGGGHLYFYDAISPIVYGTSLDRGQIFCASRYDHGGEDYLNCPMDKSLYERFWAALCSAEQVPLHAFEEERCFEGCLPIEVIAKRGRETLLHGPMKPFGLIDPKTGKQPYAVVQLRRENKEGSLYNIVGFQTKLTWPEQRRIFKMIPGLQDAEFARYGSIHRNTFINAPSLLEPTLQLRSLPRVFFAGQITGVEGYVESAATGLLAGINAAAFLAGQEISIPPPETAMGALISHVQKKPAKDGSYQPMNINYGLFPPLPKRVGKKIRGIEYAKRAIERLLQWRSGLDRGL
jgi:methylenetetrahydrofolate--tRNA-(uracil-5-)-methyltransferase